MGLGHALLHPERVRRAATASATSDDIGATMDAALGLVGLGDPGPAASAWAEGLAGRAQGFGEGLERRLREGPFGALLSGALPDGLADPSALLGRLDALITALATPDPDALRRRVMTAADALLGALPDWRPPALADGLRQEVDAALAILEAPLVTGRRDAAAHRAFRTAAEIRRRLRPLADPLPPRLAALDVKAWLRATIAAQLGALDPPALQRLGVQLGAFRDEFGRLFDALGRVSVSVELRVDGPLAMPGAVPGLDDEAKATPFAPGSALWSADLATGIFAVFNLFWEMMRTRNFVGRPFDGAVSVALLIWQAVRVTLRAAMPETIAGWSDFAQWLFTDQGDFAVSGVARLLASFSDWGDEGSNWVASVLVRGLKHVTAVTQPRAIYQFWRSLWYNNLWRGTAKGARPPHSFLRATWLVWGGMWGASSLLGLFPDWEEFRLEGQPAGIHHLLIVALGLSLVWACVAPFWLLKGSKLAQDHRTRILMSIVFALIMVLVSVLVADVESADQGLAIGAVVGVGITVVLALLASWLPFAEAIGAHVLIGLTGLVVACALPFILWWDYIDDGRDKPGTFAPFEAASSPYRLPYPEGENWMCSQGTHGIFSHHTLNGTTNHYAYDFNEREGSPLSAARGGLVTSLAEGNPNRQGVANSVHVLHTAWDPNHDPGTEEERVLTTAGYIHLTQGGVLPALGQFVRRGEDIGRIDSTGRSAQQHIHIGVTLTQAVAGGRYAQQGWPFVFGDAHAATRRNYPLLCRIEGKGNIPGKPVSYAFYISQNPRAEPAEASARQLDLAPGAAAPALHAHSLHIPAETFAGDAAEVELFADIAEGHTHRVTLPWATLEALRGPGTPTTEGVVVHPAPDGHSHAPAPVTPAPGASEALPNRMAALVAPPGARITATQPGPYPLFGGQAVLRVNDRLTEAWMFGAHRPAVVADVVAERGLAPGEALSLGGAALAPAADWRGSVTDAVAALNTQLQLARQRLALIPQPVLVIETQRRGQAARLRLREDAAGALPALGPDDVAGAGLLDDLNDLTPAALAAHVQDVLQNGWPAPMGTVVNAYGSGWSLRDLAGSAPRTARVLAAAAGGAGGSAGAIITPHPLPLQPGPVGVLGGWTAPLLAAPAMLELHLDGPGMAGAARFATPLVVRVSGSDREVRFTPEDTDASAVARRIMLAADGVRAQALGADMVRVATVAGGSAVSLALVKGAWLSPTASGRSAAPGAGRPPVTDTGAVPPDVLRAAVTEAAAAALLPYDPALVNPRARIEAGRLRLEVNAPHDIAVLDEAEALLGTADAAAGQWDSAALPARIRLGGCGWIDVGLAGAIVRVPLTGEPARIELGPPPRLPAAGARLRLEVNGTAHEVSFDGTEGSVAGVAARIAAVVPGVTLRLAWRITAAGTLHGSDSGRPNLAESAALNLLGFMAPRAGLTDAPQGPVRDAMAAGPVGGAVNAPTIPWHMAGGRFLGLNVPADGPPRIAAPAGMTLTVTPSLPTDPLALAATAPEALAAGAAFPVALPRGCAEWRFTVQDPAGPNVEAVAQLAAMPAALRAAVPPTAFPGPLPLILQVLAPGGDHPPLTLDISGAADAVAAAARLNALPGVVAFAVVLGGDTVLHVETVGRGHGWGLRAEGREALVALGFRAPLPWEDRLQARGGGPIADADAVTEQEARDMLHRAALSAVTLGQDPPAPYALPPLAGGALLLERGAMGAPPPRIASDPAGFAATLGAVETATGIRIPAIPTPPGRLRPLGALLSITTGRQRVTRALIGSPAVLRGADPVPEAGSDAETEQLHFCASHTLTLWVDGTARIVPSTATPLDGMEALAEHIARHVQPGWAGLRPDPGGGAGRFLELRGTSFGSQGRLALTWPAGAPASGLLGFLAGGTATGAGTVPDTDGLTLTDLRTALDAPEPDQPQPVLRAGADLPGGAVRLSPVGAIRIDGSITGLPPGITATPEGQGLRLVMGPALALEARLLEIRVARGPTLDSRVVAPLWGAPARLPAITLPADLGVLAGRSLGFLLNGAAVEMTLAASLGAGSNPAELAADIVRRSGWRLRAWAEGMTLWIETLQQGHGASLALVGGTAVTADPATGLTGVSLGVSAQGAGSVPDMEAVRPQDLAAAIEAGWLRTDEPSDRAQFAARPMDRRAYSPRARTGEAWVVHSLRQGVAGRLQFLAPPLGFDGLEWDHSLERGAAVRAAIILTLPAATVAPDGALVLRLDDNIGPGLPVARDVTVTFDGSALDAPAVAARINAALRAARAGAAAAWPDGRIVIETATPGLAGSIALPAPGPRGAADALLPGPVAQLAARGWPGAGMRDAYAAMQAGWRAVRPRAAGAVTYSFAAGGRETGAVSITAGMEAEAAAAALNLGFDTTTAHGAARLGLAAVLDGALCVEALVDGLELRVNGAPPVPVMDAGGTLEFPPDGGFHLRRTDLVRTTFLRRAPTDAPDFALGGLELGWLRNPMGLDAGPPLQLQPAPFLRLPGGRWLVGVRPDAARAEGAEDAAALRASVAMAAAWTDTAPLALRYWLLFDNQQLSGGALGPDGRFMLDVTIRP